MWKKVAIGSIFVNISVILFLGHVFFFRPAEVRGMFLPDLSQKQAEEIIKEYCGDNIFLFRESESGFKVFEAGTESWSKAFFCSKKLKSISGVDNAWPIFVF